MEPTRRRSGVKGNSESLDRLHDEIKTLRAQLTKAKATIARLSQGNGSQIRHSPTANLMARRFESLSPRERDIVRLYLEDPCDKKVARQLGTKPQTVRNQISTIEKKLGVESREELVICLLAVLGRPDDDS